MCGKNVDIWSLDKLLCCASYMDVANVDSAGVCIDLPRVDSAHRVPRALPAVDCMDAVAWNLPGAKLRAALRTPKIVPDNFVNWARANKVLGSNS